MTGKLIDELKTKHVQCRIQTPEQLLDAFGQMIEEFGILGFDKEHIHSPNNPEHKQYLMHICLKLYEDILYELTPENFRIASLFYELMQCYNSVFLSGLSNADYDDPTREGITYNELISRLQTGNNTPILISHGKEQNEARKIKHSIDDLKKAMDEAYADNKGHNKGTIQDAAARKLRIGKSTLRKYIGSYDPRKK